MAKRFGFKEKVLCSRAEAKAAILTGGRAFECQGYACERALEGLWGQRLYSFSVGIQSRERALLPTRHFHPIPEAHWYPKAVDWVGGIEQQDWNTFGHLVPCDNAFKISS